MITEQQRKTIIEDTINKIEVGQIVPVIGDDVFYIKDDEGRESKIHDYIVTRLIQRSGIEIDDIDIFYKKARKGFKGMTYLKRIFRENSLNLKNEIMKLYREEDIIQRAYLSDDVYTLLTTRKFPLIITTSHSNILEEKLKESGIEYRSAFYMKEKKKTGVPQDIGDTDITDEYNRLAEPTIYHILGGSISAAYDCALTENEFLQYLHHLHDTNSRPERLLEYINDQRYILALGCDIPDWTLRFLLYSFITDISRNEQVAFNGGVIDTKSDENLEEFLLNIDYYYEDVNQKRFIAEIISRLPEKSKRPNVFISVMTNDVNNPIYKNIITNEIVNVLKRKYDVWVGYERLKGKSGEPYWKEIRDGLEKCDYFMPIITDRLLKQFRGNISIDPQPDKEQGIITEWKYALKNWKETHDFKDDFVKPIKVGIELDDIKETFLADNAAEIILQLRQLVFGRETEDGQRTGLQISDYSEVNNLEF